MGLEKAPNTKISVKKLTCKECDKEYEFWVSSISSHHGMGVEYVFCSDNCCEEHRHKAKIKNVEDNLAMYMTKVGIPSKFHSIEPKRPELIQEYFLSERGLYIYGSEGTGKTVFVCNLAKKLMLSLQKVAFISMPDFIMQLQDLYRKGKKEAGAYPFLKAAADEPILIIDDMGAEKHTEYVRQAIYYLINEREQHERRTFITCNHDLDWLAERTDSRVASRIAGMCDIKDFSGDDMRVQKEML